MAKIVFVGAGSTVFARNLLGDILEHPALAQVLDDPDRIFDATLVVAHRGRSEVDPDLLPVAREIPLLGPNAIDVAHSTLVDPVALPFPISVED